LTRVGLSDFDPSNQAQCYTKLKASYNKYRKNFKKILRQCRLRSMKADWWKLLIISSNTGLHVAYPRDIVQTHGPSLLFSSFYFHNVKLISDSKFCRQIQMLSTRSRIDHSLWHRPN